jgi:hypothetical protein
VETAFPSTPAVDGMFGKPAKYRDFSSRADADSRAAVFHVNTTSLDSTGISSSFGHMWDRCGTVRGQTAPDADRTLGGSRLRAMAVVSFMTRAPVARERAASRLECAELQSGISL